MWNNRTVRFEEMFKAMQDFLEDNVGMDEEIYLVEVGDLSTQSLRDWINTLIIIGRKLMQVARGLGMMKGRNQPNQEDFQQAAYLLNTGHIATVFDRPLEDDSFNKDQMEDK